MGAAEQFLLALDSATGTEKTELRRQAKAALDRAAQIKKCETWKPASLIDFDEPTGTALEGNSSADLSPSLATDTSGPSTASHAGTAYTGRDAAQADSSPPDLLIDLSPEPAQPVRNGPPLPAPKPPKKVLQLKVPVSTRKCTKRESIILLKSSAVHGFKFPPWENNPSPTEFKQSLSNAIYK